LDVPSIMQDAQDFYDIHTNMKQYGSPAFKANRSAPWICASDDGSTHRKRTQRKSKALDPRKVSIRGFKAPVFSDMKIKRVEIIDSFG